MRKVRGFARLDVAGGVIMYRSDTDGTWVVLASHPDVKVDNKHMDRRPHIHVGGWASADRRALRAGLGAGHVVAAIARHLEQQGYIDVMRLAEELA
ncbi:MAG: hypothetical protein LC624_01455 [Halobacteriales archaeon]|nr:hypothetical protein [Halobacteriales archaeon]